MTDNERALTRGPQKLIHRHWRRVVGWSVALITILLLGLFIALEAVAHRSSPVHGTLTVTEIGAEDARLKRLGLSVPDGNFLKEHPFEPPWTTHSLLMPSSWFHDSIAESLLGSRHVRADALLSDLDVLQPVMERAYGGWDSAAARGWNWNQWFANWRKQLAEKGAVELSFDEAFGPMDTLIAFQRDNHTQIPLNRWWTSAGSQTAVLARAPEAPCVQIRAGGRLFSISAGNAGEQIRKAKLWTSGEKTLVDANYIAMPVSHGTPQAVRCGDTWISLRPVSRRGGLRNLISKLWTRFFTRDQPRIERFGDGIAYARLPEFRWSNYENVSRRNWAQRQPEDRVLIVDLRDNGGGNEDYGLDVLKGWIDETQMVPFEHIGTQLTSSCLYAPLKWDPSIQSTLTIPIGQKNFLQGLLNRMALPHPDGCPRTVATRPPQWTYLRRHFDPKPRNLRIIALVNSRCGSDCEGITAQLDSLPDTIVVGTNTYGVVQFIQPGYSVLPHTGLRYRIALGRSNYYGDDRSVDGYGLDVDVILPDVDTLSPKQMRELAEVVAKL